MILFFCSSVIFSIIIELLSVYYLFFLNEIFFLKLLYYVLLHATASLFLSISLYPIAKLKFKEKTVNILLFSFLFSLFLFFVGYIFVVVYFFVIIHLSKVRKQVPVKESSLYEILSEEVKTAKPAYGESFLVKAIHSKDIPIDQKEKVVFILSSLNTPVAVELLKKAIYLESDEIRLLALSYLSKIEKELNRKISKVMNLLEKENRPSKKGLLLKELAMLYWEIYYMNIPDKEFSTYYLNKALEYCQSAAKVLKDDYQIYFLLGKIYLRLKDLEKAKENFEKSITLNPDNYPVYIYLGEVEFLRRNFYKAKELIKKVKNVEHNYLTYSIVSVWK